MLGSHVEAAYLAAGVAFQKTQRLRVEVPEQLGLFEASRNGSG